MFIAQAVVGFYFYSFSDKGNSGDGWPMEIDDGILSLLSTLEMVNSRRQGDPRQGRKANATWSTAPLLTSL
jgi:hypothetical protein